MGAGQYGVRSAGWRTGTWSSAHRYEGCANCLQPAAHRCVLLLFVQDFTQKLQLRLEQQQQEQVTASGAKEQAVSGAAVASAAVAAPPDVSAQGAAEVPGEALSLLGKVGVTDMAGSTNAEGSMQRSVASAHTLGRQCATTHRMGRCRERASKAAWVWSTLPAGLGIGLDGGGNGTRD